MGGPGSGPRGRGEKGLTVYADAALKAAREGNPAFVKKVQGYDEAIQKSLEARRGMKGIVGKRVISRRAAVLALAVAGFTEAETAEAIGLSKASVSKLRYRMRVDGALQNTADRLDHGIVPAAMERLEELIAAGDKEAVLAVLKGRGAFKSHVAGVPGQAGGAVTSLVVKFDLPAGMVRPTLEGQVVGTPRRDEEEA